jgi:hypothetical protein
MKMACDDLEELWLKNDVKFTKITKDEEYIYTLDKFVIINDDETKLTYITDKKFRGISYWFNSAVDAINKNNVNHEFVVIVGYFKINAHIILKLNTISYFKITGEDNIELITEFDNYIYKNTTFGNFTNVLQINTSNYTIRYFWSSIQVHDNRSGEHIYMYGINEFIEFVEKNMSEYLNTDIKIALK